jgi:hypothetical protein
MTAEFQRMTAAMNARNLANANAGAGGSGGGVGACGGGGGGVDGGGGDSAPAYENAVQSTAPKAASPTSSAAVAAPPAFNDDVDDIGANNGDDDDDDDDDNNDDGDDDDDDNDIDDGEREIAEMLEELNPNYRQYACLFVAHGFDSIENFKHLQQEDRDLFPAISLGHWRHIFAVKLGDELTGAAAERADARAIQEACEELDEEFQFDNGGGGDDGDAGGGGVGGGGGLDYAAGVAQLLNDGASAVAAVAIMQQQQQHEQYQQQHQLGGGGGVVGAQNAHESGIGTAIDVGEVLGMNFGAFGNDAFLTPTQLARYVEDWGPGANAQ